MKPAGMADRHEVCGQSHDQILDDVALVDICHSTALGDVARRHARHDFVTLSGLLKAFSLQLELKILAIFATVKGPAPVASVWCGGNAANGYPLKSLGGVSTCKTPKFGPRPGLAASLSRRTCATQSEIQIEGAPCGE